jgi:hypothetical protein
MNACSDKGNGASVAEVLKLEMSTWHPTMHTVVRLQFLLYPKVMILVYFFILGRPEYLPYLRNRNLRTSRQAVFGGVPHTTYG